MVKLDKANKHDLRMLLYWLEHRDGGDGFLYGIEERTWDETELYDLIAITSRASNDGFMRWLEEKLLPRLPSMILNLWREPIRGSESTGLSRCNLTLLHILERTLNVVLAALVPSIAVLVLYFIKRLDYRLCAVAAFSTLFAVVLALFTKSRPVEIFTATAAFASVQVVFVGGTTTE